MRAFYSSCQFTSASVQMPGVSSIPNAYMIRFFIIFLFVIPVTANIFDERISISPSREYPHHSHIGHNGETASSKDHTEPLKVISHGSNQHQTPLHSSPPRPRQLRHTHTERDIHIHAHNIYHIAIW